MRIVFPENKNREIREGIEIAKANGVEFLVVEADGLEDGFLKVKNGEADAIIAGADYSSREVILSAKRVLGLSGETFSGVSIFKQKPQLLSQELERVGGARFTSGEPLGNEWETIFIADTAACKHPTEEQLFEIVCQTRKTARDFLGREPRIAVLSFSTNGSGGRKDETMIKAENVIKRAREECPGILIDGEMQLDAAMRSWVGEKKMPGSKVAGRADVLICPDLNSGNILYKSVSVFGGNVVAGPIMQGFDGLVSDLSRGSSKFDIALTIEVIAGIFE